MRCKPDELKALKTCFCSGFIWNLYSRLFFAGKEPLTTSFLTGSKSLKLSASLTGGNGDTTWQQAQLFSQSIDNKDEMCLDITVTLRDAML